MRTWLITGCSSGFGRALAEAALERGDQVVATARTVASLDGLEGASVTALDVTRQDQIDAAVQHTLDRYGAIDVLVNNAGTGSVGAVEEFTLDHLRDVMDVMFFGAVALTKAVLPHMRERGSGAIVQISSQGGQVSFAGFGAYCAAKFALEGLSDALADEVAPLGIRTLIVEPGSFRTGLLGATMHRSAEIAAYADTVGRTRAYTQGEDGRQQGDPRKAAAAIIGTLDAPEPPRRLALGADAVENIRATHERNRQDLDRWEAVSLDTAF
jgi:NAD(P)-dependent dehydrogenase (short-subunit alcohol dehydrogenase family)